MNTNILHVVIDSLPSSNAGWVDILSALLTPIVALIGVHIAYQQYKVNMQRLRHETYERRLSVYKTVQRYLSEILQNGKVPYRRTLEFYSEASEAAFLFDDSVQKKIDEIYEKSIDMQYLYEKLYPTDGSEGLPVGEERSRICEQKTELLKWHIGQLKDSRLFFAKKLGLKIN